jgi:multiple sugar transport system substrate-binding protein
MPVTGVGLSAFKTTEQKGEAAAEFVRWFTESQRNLDFVVETGYMPVRTDAFASIADYQYPTTGHANLYRTIQVMLESYSPVVRPDFDGFYNRVDALYSGLRQMRPTLIERSENGEDVSVLAESVWDFLCSVE